MSKRTVQLAPPASPELLRLRSHLTEAAAAAQLAATLPLAEARQLVNRAMAEMMDATFWLYIIERDATAVPLDGIDTDG